jgi:hypothetical protein
MDRDAFDQWIQAQVDAKGEDGAMTTRAIMQCEMLDCWYDRSGGVPTDTAFAIVDWHTEALAAIEATLTRIDRTKAAHPDFAKAMKALVRRQITELLRQ